MTNLHTKIAQHLTKQSSDLSSTTILTPNQRLASYLSKTLNQYNQLELQNTFWERPVIFQYTNWLTLLWENMQNATCLLNPAQEYALWEKVIKNNQQTYAANINVASTSQTIRDAIKAWNLLHHWGIPLEQLPHLAAIDENKIFYSWALQYQEYLATHNYCTQAEIPLRLTHALQKAHKSFPLTSISKNLLFIGFDSFSLSPQDKNFIEEITKHEICVEYFDPNQQTSCQHRLTAKNINDEITVMAEWAYAIHKNDPNATIGCVIPKLQMLHDNITRRLAETFTDPGEFIYNYGYFLPDEVNISLGTSLGKYPSINCALTILALGKETQSFDDWQNILFSPFIKDNWENYIATSKAFDKIQSLNFITQNNHYSFKQLHAILQELSHELCASIQHYKTTLATTKKIQSAKNWIALFNTQLQTFGWPGTRNLNSHEFQIIERWQKFCGEFGALDLIYPNGFGYDEALTKLTTLASNTIFQPRAPNHSKIKVNILGTLEAAGLNFDCLWIMSMDDQTWPTPPSPNPFIPLELQRKHNMPNATTTRELEFCKDIINRWQRSATQVIYSYANQDNERVNRISSLLQHIPETTLTEILTNRLSEDDKNIQKTIEFNLERHIDSSAPKVASNEKNSGGTGILQSQIACPFQAFAKYRLKAKATNKFSPKAFRGEILHKALEEIWQTLKNKDTLCKYLNNLSSLETLITTAINNGINFVLNQNNKQNFPNNFLRLEKLNLQNLLVKWLKIEAERAFFTVIETEKTAAINLGGLSLNLRIDRIDQLADGKIVIIDYKTGKEIPNIKDCENMPPTATQLPLYAIATSVNASDNSQNKIAAVFFAHINRENCVGNHKPFAGIIDQESQQLLSNKQYGKFTILDLETTITKWQESLSKVAEDFMCGVARISPCNQETCRLCGLQALCRIKEIIINY